MLALQFSIEVLSSASVGMRRVGAVGTADAPLARTGDPPAPSLERPSALLVLPAPSLAARLQAETARADAAEKRAAAAMAELAELQEPWEEPPPVFA